MVIRGRAARSCGRRKEFKLRKTCRSPGTAVESVPGIKVLKKADGNKDPQVALALGRYEKQQGFRGRNPVLRLGKCIQEH
jgi:hypothetical protein